MDFDKVTKKEQRLLKAFMTDNMSADRWIGYIFTEHSSIVGINAVVL